jgi:ribosome-associated toxin RatA of RatAB toxin-antitoxin module
VCAVTDASRSTISIHAEPAAVMNVIVDVASYPQWINFLKGVEILQTDASGRPLEARFVLDAGVIVDDYTLAYTWSDDEVSWHLVSGTSIKAMDGSYQLHATAVGTDVDYALSIDVSVSLLPVLKRKAEQVLIDTALRALKTRVEA